MKNMLKRLTSLLLVFAMLLSFAAVVGAENDIVAKLSVDNVTMKAGETVYVPVRLTKLTEDYIVGVSGMVTSDEGAAIQAQLVADNDNYDSSSGKGATIDPTLGTFIWGNVTQGFNVNHPRPFFWVKVTSNTPGTYALHIGALKDKNGNVGAVISTLNQLASGTTTVDATPHGEDEVEFIDGSITVLPADAKLPTLIMTKTSFPRPTKAGGDGTQSYDLAQYVKLVRADGSVTNAENLSVTGEKVVGDKLQLSYTDKGSTTVTVSAGGLSKQITLDITSGRPVLTSVEFANVFEESYTAPAPGEERPKTIDLDIRAYDQYGDKMENATTRAQLTLSDNTANDSVYLQDNKIHIKSDLANDVTCTVIPFAQDPEQQGESRSFTVKSSLPKATNLTIKGETMELQVPVEGQTSTATFTASLKDQYGHDCTLELPQWSVSLDGVGDGQLTNYVTYSTAEGGAQITVTLLPKAKELLADKNQVQLTLTITANGLTSAGKAVQIQKATPRATSLGRYYDSKYQSGFVATNHTALSMSGGRGIAVPGIDETMNRWKMEPIYLFDQYGQVIMQDGKAVYAPAKNLNVTLWHADNNGVPGTEVSPEAYEIIPQDDGSVVIAITNKLDAAGNLLFTAGDYQLKIAYGDLTLTSGKYKFDYNSVYKATVTADKETVALPYTGYESVYLTVDVKDQYGKAPKAAVTAEISEFRFGVAGIFKNKIDSKIHTSTNTEDGKIEVVIWGSLSEQMPYYWRNNWEASRPVTPVMTIKVGDTELAGENVTVPTITVTQDATPKISRVRIELDGTTVVNDKTGGTHESSLVVPIGDSEEHTVKINVYDQYDRSYTPDDSETIMTTTPPTNGSMSYDQAAKKLTVTKDAEGQAFTFRFPASTAEKTWTVQIRAAAMQFVNGKTGTEPLKISDLFQKQTATYDASDWKTLLSNPTLGILNKTFDPYIKNPDGTTTSIISDVNIVIKTADGTVVYDGKNDVSQTATVQDEPYTVSVTYNGIPICPVGSFTIQKRVLTLGGNTPGSKTISKEYDGKYDTYTWATGENWTNYVQLTSGVLEGDTVFLNENQTGVSVKFFVKDGLQPSKDAGEKTVRLEIPAAGALTGKDAGNYKIGGTDGNDVIVAYRDGKITPKHIKVTITALDKPWDSTNSLSGLQVTWSGCVDGEGLGVDVSQKDLTFNGTDVGSWISNAEDDLGKITWAFHKLINAEYQHTILENYTVTREDVTFENFGQNGAKIKPVTLTLKGVQSRTGTYGDADSTLLALGEGVTVVRSVSSSTDDNLTKELGTMVRLFPGGAEKTGDYYNANQWPYTLGAVLEGVNPENYTLYVANDPTLKIDPKPVTVALKDGVTITKTYDGTNALPDEITADSFAVTGAVGTDVLTVDLSKMTYLSEDVGNNIPLSVDSGLLKAANGLVSNYEINTETAFSGAITAREITVTPKAGQTFEYGSDQIAAALGSAYDVTGNLEGEHAAKLTGSMALLSTDAGTRTVTQGDLALASESAQNYTLEFTGGVTWKITPKTVDAVTASIEAEFGKSTDELLALLGGADVTIGTETVKLSDLGQKLSFPTLTTEQYAVDADRKQYPVPGTYTVTVSNPTTVQRNNYQVTGATTYSLTVTVNESQKALTVDLYTDEGHTTAYTDQSFSYNGEERTVFAEYRFQLDDGKILRLPSVNMGGETNATNAGTYTVRIGSPCCQPGSAEWKINTRQIKAALKNPISAPYGTELNDLLTVSADKLTVTATDGGTLPSGDKAPQWSGKLKVNGTKNAAGYYDVGEFNVGVETLQETSGNYAVDHDEVIGKLSVTKNAATPFTTNPVEAPVTRGAEATIQVPAGYRFTDDKDLFSFGTPKDATGADAQILTKPAEIVLSQGSNGSLSVKVSIQDDANLVGKVYTLPLTLADSGNHGTFTVELKLTVTDKPQQTGFAAKDAAGNVEGSYSYSQASVLLHAENAKGNVTWTSEKETIAKVETNGKVTFERPGTVRIKAVSDETGGYAEATAYYTLTVTMGQITVTASSATMTANDPLPSFTAMATGLNPMDSASDVFQTMTASVSTDGKTAGTFRVTPYAAFKTDGTAKHWEDYYTLAFVPGTLTVLPATSVIDTVLPLIIGGNGCANGYANCACESFYDLDAGRWYHEAIDWAYNLGLMNGTTKTTFGPNAAATRAQTWTMLARIAGQDTGRSSTWYEVGRTWAMGLGITDGANPMGTLTREQLAAMLYRYVGSPAVSGALRFADSASVSSWARDAMVWAVQNGILDGVGGNRLNPKGTTTRAQAAAIFMRFQKLMNR